MGSNQGRTKVARWIALGTLLGVATAWGGFSVVDAAPSSITTCTKTRNNKTKIIPASSSAACTAKGKGTVNTWDNHSLVAGQVGAQDAQIANLQTEESNFCTEYSKMVNYLEVNDSAAALGLAAYQSQTLSWINAYSALCT